MNISRHMTYFYLLFTLLCSPANAENGNGHLPGAMPVSKLKVKGAHNISMSYAEGWVYAQQSEDIESLWQGGVRMIKVPVQWYKVAGPLESVKQGLNRLKAKITKSNVSEREPFLALCHEYPGTNNCKLTRLQRAGKDPQPVKQLFERLTRLLESNPKEVFILKLESYLGHRSKDNGTENYSDQRATEILLQDLQQSGLARFAISLEGRSTALTLGEMRTSGKRLIILIDPKFSVMPPYLNSFSDYAKQTHWDEKLMGECGLATNSGSAFFEANINPEVSLSNQDAKGKIVGALNKVGDKLGISSGIVRAHDYSQVNSKENILNRLKTCYEKHGITPNIITSDFVNIGDLSTVVNDMNAEEAKKYK